MSGGSYDYFYSRAPDKLSEVASALEGMASDCEGEDGKDRGYGPVDTDAMIMIATTLRAIAWKIRNAQKLVEKMEDVTRAIEWWQSGDSLPNDAVEAYQNALAKLKGEK